MRHCLTMLAIAVFGAMLTGPCAAASWPSDKVSLLHAVHIAAESSSDRDYVVETWFDVHIVPTTSTEVGANAAYTFADSPSKRDIPRPAAGITGRDLVLHIKRNHGGLKVLENANVPVTNIVRNELAGNPNWPLNRPLKGMEHETLTFGQAKQLLQEQCSLRVEPSEKFLGLAAADVNGVVVWKGDMSNESAQCRDLLDAMIAKVAGPGKSFKVVPVGKSSVNSAEQERAAKTRTDFEWSVGRN